jgi:hypothetical protein
MHTQRFISIATALLLVATTAPTMAQTPPTPATKPDAVPLAKSAEGLTVGLGGFLKISMLLQAWYQVKDLKDTVTTPGKTTDTWTNALRLRRAEFQVKGELMPKRIAYGLMIDPAKLAETKETTLTVDVPMPDGFLPKDKDGYLLKADGTQFLGSDGKPMKTLTLKGSTKSKQSASTFSILQDFWISVLTDYADISVGQFKIPVSYEGFNSSGVLLFAERSLVSSAFGDKRDLGVRIDKRFKYVYYNVSLFNGAGANNFEFDHRKELAARVEITPLPWLMFGGVAYATLRPAGKDDNAKERYEADVRLDTHGFLFQAEYIRARDWDATLKKLVTGQGFYTSAAYIPVPEWQIAVRGGLLDEDVLDLTPATRTRVWEFGGGLHWMPLGHAANLKLDYFLYKPTHTTPTRKGTEHQVVLAAQVRF